MMPVSMQTGYLWGECTYKEVILGTLDSGLRLEKREAYEQACCAIEG